MKRRDVIALLGGAVMPALMPFVARAQQREPVRRIGIILSSPCRCRCSVAPTK